MGQGSHGIEIDSIGVLAMVVLGVGKRLSRRHDLPILDAAIVTAGGVHVREKDVQCLIAVVEDRLHQQVHAFTPELLSSCRQFGIGDGAVFLDLIGGMVGRLGASQSR